MHEAADSRTSVSGLYRGLRGTGQPDADAPAPYVLRRLSPRLITPFERLNPHPLPALRTLAAASNRVCHSSVDSVRVVLVQDLNHFVRIGFAFRRSALLADDGRLLHFLVLSIGLALSSALCSLLCFWFCGFRWSAFRLLLVHKLPHGPKIQTTRRRVRCTAVS